MDVQLPDGTVLKGVPDGTTKDQIATKLQASGKQVPPDWLAPKGPTSKEIGEANLAASRSEHGPVQDVIDMAKAIPGGAADTLKGIGTAVMHPIDTITSAAGKIPGAIDAALHPVETTKKIGKALEEATPQQVGKQIGGALALGPAGKTAGVLGEAAAPVVKAALSTEAKAATPAIAAARQAGYVLKPSEAGGKVGKIAEGLSGSPKLSVEASLKNQPITNKLGGEQIGLKEGTKITRDALRQARKPHNEVYKEVSNLGEISTDDGYHQAIADIGRTPGKSFKKATNPDIEKLRQQYADEDRFESSDAVLEVRRLRAASSKNIKAVLAPAQNELGYAQKQVADAIEDQIERHAAQVGRQDLIPKLKASRQSLAQIHSVESAMVGSTGDISAAKLSKMQQKGVPLTGNLKLIADTYDQFGEVMRDASKLKNKVPVTVLEGGAGVAGAVMTATHSPAVGIPLVAGMVARPAARKYLLSDAYQNRLGKGPKKHTLSELDQTDQK